MSRSNRNLTPLRLLYLAGVRHLGNTNARAVARLVGRSVHSANIYIYGSREWVGLIELGYLSNRPNCQRTLRLTEAGQAAVHDVALIFEGDGVSVGKVAALNGY